MKLLYSKEKYQDIYPQDYLNGGDQFIFLAGPTPRSQTVKSWRPDILSILENQKFDGVACIPEDRDGNFKGSYIDQVEWEYEWINESDVLIFWVPRDLETMPAFTTNVEFGFYINRSQKIFYGRPDESPKNKYLDWLYEKETRRKPHNNMESLVKESLCELQKRVIL